MCFHRQPEINFSSSSWQDLWSSRHKARRKCFSCLCSLPLILSVSSPRRLSLGVERERCRLLTDWLEVWRTTEEAGLREMSPGDALNIVLNKVILSLTLILSLSLFSIALCISLLWKVALQPPSHREEAICDNDQKIIGREVPHAKLKNRNLQRRLSYVFGDSLLIPVFPLTWKALSARMKRQYFTTCNDNKKNL